MSAWESIGDARLEAIVGRLVAHFFDDFIIGYLFTGKDPARIAAHELELARAHLGGPSAYSGRPLPEVHKPLRINRGHFRRRLAIVAHVLREEGVDEAIVEEWLSHERALEPAIVDGSDCAPPSGTSSPTQ